MSEPPQSGCSPASGSGRAQNAHQESDGDAHRNAVRWFARLLSGKMTAEQLQSLETWLQSDVRGAEAFADLATLWLEIGVASSDRGLTKMRRDALRVLDRLK